MREFIVTRQDVSMRARIDGPDDPAAPTMVFANALGTDLHIWDSVVSLLPDRLRIVRYDMRGHGASDVPPPPYTMGTLISDAAAVCDAAQVRDSIFVGLSVGGMVAQGLAVKRPDIMRAMVLSNTAAKIGNPPFWEDRIATVRKHGMTQVADGTMQRWFGRSFYATPAMRPWYDMLIATQVEGYTGVCAAISGTDFFTSTSGLRLPTLGIAGTEDGSTPPDLVRETTDLIPGSQFQLIRRAGHLPCVENPAAYAEVLNDFLISTGHMIQP